MEKYYLKYSITKKIKKEQVKKLNLDNINYIKFYDFNKTNDFLRN